MSRGSCATPCRQVHKLFPCHRQGSHRQRTGFPGSYPQLQAGLSTLRLVWHVAAGVEAPCFWCRLTPSLIDVRCSPSPAPCHVLPPPPKTWTLLRRRRKHRKHRKPRPTCAAATASRYANRACTAELIKPAVRPVPALGMRPAARNLSSPRTGKSIERGRLA